MGPRKCEPFFGIIGAFLTFNFWCAKLGQRSYFYTSKVKILRMCKWNPSKIIINNHE